MKATTPMLLAALLLLTDGAQASRQCPTRSEARGMYPRAYLYWHTDAGGNRCWSNRRIKSEARYRPQRHAVVASSTSLLAPPPSLPALMPQPVVERERTILDSRQWAWVAEARAAAHADDRVELEPVFSTFPGEPPGVWPRLEAPPQQNVAGLIIVLFTGMLAMAFGLLLWRSRVRISMIYRGYKIEYDGRGWFVSRGSRVVHRADSRIEGGKRA